MVQTRTYTICPAPYLFNIFIDQLLLDLNNSDAGVIIGNERYNCMAYADDVTLVMYLAYDLYMYEIRRKIIWGG